MDRLTSMRVFLRVADEGGFAAAARAMDMSPAVVTRLVADLEEHLGTRLLQRTTRRQSLTDAGEAYLDRVRHILQDLDDAHSLVSSQTQELSGTLRVLEGAWRPWFLEQVKRFYGGKIPERFQRVARDYAAAREARAQADRGDDPSGGAPSPGGDP